MVLASIDSGSEGDLRNVFQTFSSFGSSQVAVEMEGKNFAKFCKDCRLLSKAFTATDADLVFAKIKTKGARKIVFSEFLAGLGQIAARKGTTLAELANQVIAAGGPSDSGTKAEAVRFHDDKSLYTGVYANGGPTNVDRSKDLSGLCNRAAANVRGVNLSSAGSSARSSPHSSARSTRDSRDY